ncbi:MAG: 50S ribosomal protein L9, partial [Clostridiales bacterium]|nr:50S ribosomal protein L9 [Clostridiales bacterium]
NEANQKAAAEKKRAETARADAADAAEKLKNTLVEVKVKCGDGKIYGSVTSKEIADALKARGFVIDKKQIVLKETVKALGRFEVDVKLYAGISAKIILQVVRE